MQEHREHAGGKGNSLQAPLAGRKERTLLDVILGLWGFVTLALLPSVNRATGAP